MNAKKRKSKFAITVKYFPTPMTRAEWEASEDLLARMVARAIWVDYRKQSEEVGND
jgi:hypothetical protein